MQMLNERIRPPDEVLESVSPGRDGEGSVLPMEGRSIITQRAQFTPPTSARCFVARTLRFLKTWTACQMSAQKMLQSNAY